MISGNAHASDRRADENPMVGVDLVASDVPCTTGNRPFAEGSARELISEAALRWTALRTYFMAEPLVVKLRSCSRVSSVAATS